ncbi:MAG: calcium-binding protein [Pseudomonadota bacterium]
MPIFFNTPTGGDEDDFVLGHPAQGGGGDNSLFGGGGDDVLFGETDFFFNSSGTLSSPVSLTQIVTAWSTIEHPDVALSTSIPHTSIFRDVTEEAADVYSVTTSAPGQRLILDIDYGDHRNGVPVDVIIDVLRSDNTLLARLDNQPRERGSLVAEAGGDLILPEAGTFKIQVREVGSAVLPVGATFMLNVSLTGQQVTNQNPIIGNDVLFGGDGNDVVYGMGGVDSLFGGAGDDLLDGGSGSDMLFGGGGADFMFGGAGIDVVSYEFSGGPVIARLDGGLNGGAAAGDRYFLIEGLSGSTRGDLLIGNSQNNAISGGDGNDTIIGGGGVDTLVGGAGNDTLSNAGGTAIFIGDNASTVGGSENFDTVTYASYGRAVGIRLDDQLLSFGAARFDRFAGIENFIGSRFNDSFVGNEFDNRFEGGFGVDRFDGRGGIDTVSFFSATGMVGARLDGIAGFGQAAGETFVNIENLVGGRFNDVLVGDNRSNVLGGQGGDDTVFGGGGNDVLIGGAGVDVFHGGAGFDKVSYDAATAGVGARLDAAPSFGEAAGDQYFTVENLAGSRFNDLLHGNNSNNILEGGAGNDNLFTGGGFNSLFGGAGDDVLFDGSGINRFSGGDGFDTLSYQFAVRGAGIIMSGGTSFGAAAGDVIGGDIERIIGTNFNDLLVGDANDNTLDGGGGVDRFFGGDGIMDTVDYSRSAGPVGARLDGGINFGKAAGETYDGIESLIGTRFNDVLVGDDDDKRIDGFTGVDTFFGNGSSVSYESSPTAVGIRMDNQALNFGEAAGDRYFNIAGIQGSEFNDVLVGGNTGGPGRLSVMAGGGGDDRLFVGQGVSRLDGGEGRDTFFGATADLGGNEFVMSGGDGNDVFFAGIGAESFFGGDGFDILDYRNAKSGVLVGLGQPGGFVVIGGGEGDQWKGIEILIGSNFADTLGAEGPALIKRGLGGNDLLNGIGSVAETLDGGTGNDRLTGGNSDGLAGSFDTYIFRPREGNDTISTFNDDDDTIQFDGFGFRGVFDALNRAIDTGADVLFRFDQGGSLRVENTTKAELFDDILIT